MPDARYPDWHHFRDLIAAGNPLALAVSGTPEVTLRFSPDPPTLAVEIGGDDSGRRLPELPEAIAAVRLHRPGGTVLSVSSRSTEAFAQFYAFATGLADEVQLEGVVPHNALTSALVRWRRLLEETDIQSPAGQAGLVGELLVLRAHMRAIGGAAVNAWVGPLDEPHDFRFDGADLEVKTTLRDTRSHMIASLGQMEPLPGRPLGILSIGLRLAPEGPDTFSVTRLIDAIRGDLDDEGALALAKLTRSVGWWPASTAFHFLVRLPPAVHLVDARTPRIVRDHLVSNLGAATAPRVSRVQYTIDLSDLVVAVPASPLDSIFDFGALQ